MNLRKIVEVLEVYKGWQFVTPHYTQRTWLCDVAEFEKRTPRTEAQLKNW